MDLRGKLASGSTNSPIQFPLLLHYILLCNLAWYLDKFMHTISCTHPFNSTFSTSDTNCKTEKKASWRHPSSSLNQNVCVSFYPQKFISLRVPLNVFAGFSSSHRQFLLFSFLNEYTNSQQWQCSDWLAAQLEF